MPSLAQNAVLEAAQHVFHELLTNLRVEQVQRHLTPQRPIGATQPPSRLVRASEHVTCGGQDPRDSNEAVRLVRLETLFSLAPCAGACGQVKNLANLVEARLQQVCNVLVAGVGQAQTNSL